MRYIILTLCLLLSTNAYAGGSSQAPVYAEAARNVSGIIPPEVATSMRTFYRWTVASDGTTVVCPYSEWYSNQDNTCIDGNKANRWTRLKDVVPAGKTYAGFQYIAYGDRIAVYWR